MELDLGMPDAVLRKSYTVVVVRSTGQQMDLETLSDYQSAINSAKNALTNNNNSEVRVVENKYDDATKRDKKQVVKILTRQESGAGNGSAAKSRAKDSGVSHEVANQFSKGIVNIVLAITVLVLLAGIVIPLMNR
ncbi:MAG: hypothetical protein GYB52_17065 [Rhodospirillales bacterium]|jgi:preprotein translocase subunit SecF|uniref:Uncharacterized protein n=2 Tax=Thalassospiraceae TaxID=2844866 RepID=A0ABR5XYL6_9PROT|nr:hypothetical protein AUP40_04050 [Thalassospira xiamenensis]MBL4843712.1 hypothetical protein [Thalassospira sp.]MBR9778874.1 hypothetical protein [Rhodospirillales bacterium]QPL37540.1 hypothetical protein IT971_09720 [Thalassospira sp. B30-1]KZD08011.1 hypothetical protein AUP45_17175 [Thalassospira xiamenensis]|tara:strand:- start:7848 stop:8252 length:405 start_codon:yes stop_codon:yes gene_type:complete